MPNVYPDRFTALLADVPPNGRVLDAGAGGRGDYVNDPRVVLLEYVAHPFNTVQADAARLPFRDDVFDLILSQAVLEHVKDPAAAVAEMARVARPGGLVYIEVAFMQPLHQDPWHFFNVTPHGLDHLCDLARLDIIERGAFGSIADQLAWFATEAGASPVELSAIRRVGRSMDSHVTASQLRRVASGVSVLAAKRGAATVHGAT